MSVKLDRLGWENGTLVSKAKVSVEGKIYEVEPAQYSGKTPMSAENLKKMENNTEKAINEATETYITTGKEFETNNFIDGKRVYGKRINCGNLPNSSEKIVETGLDVTKIEVVNISGIASSSTGGIIPINISYNDFLRVGVFISSDGVLKIRSNDDRSSYKAYVEIYYTKK